MKGFYVVAGATGAIGKRICMNIAEKGGTPVLVGRCANKLKTVLDEIKPISSSISSPMIISGVDFMDPVKAGETVASELKGETLNGLVYSVGSITLKPLRGSKLDDFMDSYTVNVLGAVEIIKAALPGLKKGVKNSGDSSSIVLFSSIAARHGLANHSVIGCSKAAIEGLTVSLAAELASSSIRVNCVAPSLTTSSEMAKPMTDNPKIASAVAAAHPIPRLGNPEDSANAATFLLSSSASWTTGSILPVDGGRSSILK